VEVWYFIECRFGEGFLDLLMNFESLWLMREGTFEGQIPHFTMLQPWSNAILNIGLICLLSI
jgi:hypothetical protein